MSSSQGCDYAEKQVKVCAQEPNINPSSLHICNPKHKHKMIMKKND